MDRKRLNLTSAVVPRLFPSTDSSRLPAHLDIDQPVTVAQPRHRGQPPAPPSTDPPLPLTVPCSDIFPPIYTRRGRNICRPARYN